MDKLKDTDGRTAQEFMQEHFEHQFCPECGKDKNDHTPILITYGTASMWFAKCNSEME